MAATAHEKETKHMLDPMYLSEVEGHDDPGPRGDIIRYVTE
jgi:hypothetical protein